MLETTQSDRALRWPAPAPSGEPRRHRPFSNPALLNLRVFRSACLRPFEPYRTPSPERRILANHRGLEFAEGGGIGWGVPEIGNAPCVWYRQRDGPIGVKPEPGASQCDWEAGLGCVQKEPVGLSRVFRRPMCCAPVRVFKCSVRRCHELYR